MVQIHHPPHCLQRPLIQPYPAAQTVIYLKLDLQNLTSASTAILQSIDGKIDDVVAAAILKMASIATSSQRTANMEHL